MLDRHFWPCSLHTNPGEVYHDLAIRQCQPTRTVSGWDANFQDQSTLLVANNSPTKLHQPCWTEQKHARLLDEFLHNYFIKCHSSAMPHIQIARYCKRFIPKEGLTFSSKNCSSLHGTLSDPPKTKSWPLRSSEDQTMRRLLDFTRFVLPVNENQHAKW